MYYAVLCRNGAKTDGVLYSEKNKAESTRLFADKQSLCKECSPHKIIELVENNEALTESELWLAQTARVSRALGLDPSGDIETRIKHQLEQIELLKAQVDSGSKDD